MKRQRFWWLNDTCRYANGWDIRGALSSLFWRFFEFGWFLTYFVLGFLTFSSFQNWAYVLGFFTPFFGEFSSILDLFLFAFRNFIWVILDSLSPSFRSFFVGVSRFVDNNLGPPPLKGFVSTDSVLHWLAAELYSIVYPAISTWGFIQGLMAANETEWSLPLSYELPEGLSDEFPEGEARKVSSEARPSTSGSRPVSRVNGSWKAMSYFSKIDQEDINRMRTRYQIPDDVVLRILDPDERACCPKYEDDVAFYKVDF
jgi:hypothetical protein